MVTSCLLCGVGGQGIVLASKLIAASAMEKGMLVRTAETIGMAQRGGCVVSHVRYGDKVNSSMIPVGGADVIIAFEPAEAVRNLAYLKKNGTVIVNKKAVMPVTASLGGSSYSGEEMLDYLRKNVKNLVVADGDRICAECGSPKVLNVALLACAANSGALGISVDELKNAIGNRVNPKFRELNFKAVDIAAGGSGNVQ